MNKIIAVIIILIMISFTFMISGVAKKELSNITTERNNQIEMIEKQLLN